jgi:hypothetical protein
VPGSTESRQGEVAGSPHSDSAAKTVQSRRSVVSPSTSAAARSRCRLSIPSRWTRITTWACAKVLGRTFRKAGFTGLISQAGAPHPCSPTPCDCPEQSPKLWPNFRVAEDPLGTTYTRPDFMAHGNLDSDWAGVLPRRTKVLLLSPAIQPACLAPRLSAVILKLSSPGNRHRPSFQLNDRKTGVPGRSSPHV